MDYLYLHAKTIRADGDIDTAYTIKCESKHAPLWWQEKGLSYTASGYGKRIPTERMIKFNGKWRRVYVYRYSNAGTAYIGKWVTGRGAEFIVS